MRKKYYILYGDVISSRRIKNKKSFQKKIVKIYEDINDTFINDFYIGLYLSKHMIIEFKHFQYFFNEIIMMNIIKFYEFVK